jgi:hypothetical protein
VFFEDAAEFEANADRLSQALATDIVWIRKHTEYSEAARQWTAASRPGKLQLPSPALEDAERRIASRPANVPPPTEDTQAFVAESLRGTSRQRGSCRRHMQETPAGMFRQGPPFMSGDP